MNPLIKGIKIAIFHKNMAAHAPEILSHQGDILATQVLLNYKKGIIQLDIANRGPSIHLSVAFGFPV